METAEGVAKFLVDNCTENIYFVGQSKVFMRLISMKQYIMANLTKQAF